LLAGDESAFDRFVETFRKKIFQYSYLMCRQREDAEEVAQETLLKVFENFEQLREPERVRSWIYRIARNACYMKRRKSVFAPEEEISLESLFPFSDHEAGERRLQIADAGERQDAHVLRGELREILDEAIGNLPEIYRTVILLRDVEELSTEETAEILDVSREVIKTRLHRGRVVLRQMLDRHLKAARQ
jgi:RNA polymerase sigma-70 factor (ECF subfamily)